MALVGSWQQTAGIRDDGRARNKKGGGRLGVADDGGGSPMNYKRWLYYDAM